MQATLRRPSSAQSRDPATLDTRLQFLQERMAAQADDPHASTTGEYLRDPIFLRGQSTTSTQAAVGHSLQLDMRPSLTYEDVGFDIAHLEQVMLGMMFDRTAYARDPAHVTRLLKNTTMQGSMLLDGLERMLPQYGLLKGVVVTPTHLIFSLKSPVQEEAMRELIDGNVGGFDLTVQLQKSQRGMLHRQVMRDGVELFGYRSYQILAPYAAWISQGNEQFAQGMQAVSELVTEIHRDRELLQRHRTIHLAQYLPIFRMIEPDHYRDGVLSEFVAAIRQRNADGGIPTSEAFSETRRSKLYRRGADDAKRYLLDAKYLPEHLTYVIAIPAENSLLMRFDADFDFPMLAKHLVDGTLCQSPDGLWLTEPVYSRELQYTSIQKGGGKRKKSWFTRSGQREIYHRDDGTVLQLSGTSIAKLPLKGAGRAYELGTAVLDGLYDHRLFLTSSVRTEERDCALTEFEREVIPAVDSLVHMHTLFLEVEEGRAAYAKSIANGTPIDYQTSLEWVTQTMRDAPATPFTHRVLHVLRELDQRVNPGKFHTYAGRHDETLNKLNAAYRELQRMRGQFELLCAAR